MPFKHELSLGLAISRRSLVAISLAALACDAATVTAVPMPVASVVVSPAVVSLVENTTVQLTADVRDSIGNVILGWPVNWQSSNPTLFTVDSDGSVTGRAAGSAIVIATIVAASGLASDTAQVFVARAQDSPTVLFGVHSDLTWPANDRLRVESVRIASQLGVQVMRVALMWPWIEWRQGKRDWSVPDSVVATLLREGIEPVLFIYGSPPWANGVDESVGADHYLYIPTDSSAFRSWVEEYGEFIRAAVRRYRTSVHKWELWNEPNHPDFWLPEPNFGQYLEWYAHVYSVIKEEDPDAKIAAGSLTNLEITWGTGIVGRDFLTRLYESGVPIDVVSIHPYASRNQPPDTRLDGLNNFADIEMIRQVMLDHGGLDDEVWITEWGWIANGGVSRDVEAEYLRRSLEMISQDYSSFVSIATYYEHFGQPGLLTRSLEVTPAGRAYQQHMQALSQR